ncbi:acyl-CoA dehydrogenase family protein [Mycobacterium talmoniae]|uniref:Acyl-CoA dehydrogenase n=1 Tax=Mycobacterium talmoniae TaxID=1858794 RepID=A0A1S1NFR5_9MYCO|nr:MULTISPECIES: acyl-CoA dehydrogenase family protein [Mycobacterium]OHV00592.1 acyl-CoA dehydrogenase [Mycobacterium talmoniae]TDH56018.1 acyl-CoA dehydrogenase [Mycobacterium eburneum]
MNDVLEAVRPLLPAIAAAAADVDRYGAVDPAVIAGLADAGVFAMLQPTAFGGGQAEPDDYLAVVRDIAAACTSTGWLAGMFAVTAWHLALFDHRAQQDVWATDPGALLCASYGPTGRLEPVGDGFRLTGRWSRCAGVRHASWLIAGALVVGADGAAEDFTVAVVPRTDYVVEPVWNAVGLRGIGADEVVVSGATVPRYRTFGWVSAEQRGELAALYRLPQPTLYTHAGTTPVLGAALGLLAGRATTACPPLSPVALAGADLTLSVLQMRRNLTELMDCARADASPDAALMLRARRDQVLSFERAMNAVRLFIGQSDDDGRAERVWRDVQTARMHVANDVDRVLAVVGEFAFGLPVDEFIL